MSTIAVAKARAQFAELLTEAQTEAVTIERAGSPAAVVISPRRYEELLEAWEEMQDVAAFDEAIAEAGDAIPWETVKSDLGWT